MARRCARVPCMRRRHEHESRHRRPPLVYLLIADARTPKRSVGRLCIAWHRMAAVLVRLGRPWPRDHAPGRADALVSRARGGAIHMNEAIARPLISLAVGDARTPERLSLIHI